MEATILDMRRNPKKILEAIERNEVVTLTRRGKPVARIAPIGGSQRPNAAAHEAVGMWADRDDMANPSVYVREMRKGRFDDL